MERYLILKTEKADELKRLDLLIRYEREKRKQLELAREREERAKAALDALRDLVSADKFARIQQILLEGEGDTTAEPAKGGAGDERSLVDD
jgi:hypothetical protein